MKVFEQKAEGVVEIRLQFREGYEEDTVRDAIRLALDGIARAGVKVEKFTEGDKRRFSEQ